MANCIIKTQDGRSLNVGQAWLIYVEEDGGFFKVLVEDAGRQYGTRLGVYKTRAEADAVLATIDNHLGVLLDLRSEAK